MRIQIQIQIQAQIHSAIIRYAIIYLVNPPVGLGLFLILTCEIF